MALTDEELRKLDAEYRSFAPFAAWASIELPRDVWDRYVERLLSFRSQLTPEQGREMLQRSLRAAALNTGAIEGLHGADRGLTVTVVEHVADWQAAVQRAEGDDALALVTAALDGFDMALDVATSTRPITEVWIRQVHQVVCNPQRTFEVRTATGVQRQALPLGKYKASPNHVELADGSRHAYAPVDRTPDEMHRLVTELGSESFGTAHPVLQAAFAHHALTAVHPFADGNGRVARILASVYLLRTASVPFFVFDDQKVEYFDTLEAADLGALARFSRFVFDRGLDTVRLAETWARGSSVFERSDDEVDRLVGAAERLRGALRDSLDEAALSLSLRVPADVTVESEPNELPPWGTGVQYLREPLFVAYIRATDGEPVRDLRFAVVYDPRRNGIFPLGIAFIDETDEPSDVLDVRLSDVDPVLSSSLTARVEAWCRAVLADAVGPELTT